ncbi:MAG: SoxR reducing system RseC family protein [Bacteroidales bacterium]
MRHHLMSSTQCIDHTGIVEKVNEKSVLVRFQSPSACGSCSAKSLCAPAASGNKIIEVFTQSGSFSQGDAVKVSITRAMGNKALFYGYLLPFLLVITTLIITFSLGLSENIAGLLSLSVLIPYYLTIYLLKEKINRMFVFTLKKPI